MVPCAGKMVLKGRGVRRKRSDGKPGPQNWMVLWQMSSLERRLKSLEVQRDELWNCCESSELEG